MKYVISLRIDKKDEEPQLLRLAEFEHEDVAKQFLSHLRQLWWTSVSMKEEE